MVARFSWESIYEILTKNGLYGIFQNILLIPVLLFRQAPYYAVGHSLTCINLECYCIVRNACLALWMDGHVNECL